MTESFEVRGETFDECGNCGTVVPAEELHGSGPMKGACEECSEQIKLECEP